MHVPVVARPRGQARVGGGEEARREERRDDAPEEGVDAEGGEDLVHVEGKGAQVEGVGEGEGGADEGEGRGEEGVPHCGEDGGGVF